MDTYTIIGQVFSVLAAITSFISFQFKKPLHLIIANSICAVLMTISYYFLGAYSGMALNGICLVRNLTYAAKGKGRFFDWKGWPIVYSLAMVAAVPLTWNGPMSLLITVALIINTWFISLNDNQKLRYSILVTSTMVIIYNVYVFSLGGILYEGIGIVSSIIGIIRYSKLRKAPSEPCDTASDVPIDNSDDTGDVNN